DGGAERDVAVIYIERGLGLVHAAAARTRKEMDDQRGDSQADDGGKIDEAELMSDGRITEEVVEGPVNEDAERHHCKARERANDDGQKEKEALTAKERCETRLVAGGSP